MRREEKTVELERKSKNDFQGLQKGRKFDASFLIKRTNTVGIPSRAAGYYVVIYFPIQMGNLEFALVPRRKSSVCSVALENISRR